VTGVLSYESIRKLTDKLEKKYPNVVIHLYKIVNDFFGHRITVTGLLTGGDIVRQLAGKELGEKLILPSNVLKADEDIFLDDMTLEEFKQALQVEVCIVESNGAEFIHSIIE
jgi:NifB/MoaA-like Fe-S oxidoreductase